MATSVEKDIATKKWFDEGEFKDWLVKLENSLPQEVSNPNPSPNSNEQQHLMSPVKETFITAMLLRNFYVCLNETHMPSKTSEWII